MICSEFDVENVHKANIRNKIEIKLLLNLFFPTTSLYPSSDPGNEIWLYNISLCNCDLCEFWVSEDNVQIKKMYLQIGQGFGFFSLCFPQSIHKLSKVHKDFQLILPSYMFEGRLYIIHLFIPST